MAQEIISDAKLKALEVTCGTYFNTIRLRGVADGIYVDDAATYGQLSTVNGQLTSTINYILIHGGGGGSDGCCSSLSTLISSFVDVSTIVSTLSYYVAVEACLLVDTRNQLSTLTSSFVDVSTIVSTLSYYVAVEACLLVDTRNSLSTLTSSFTDVSTIVSTLSYYSAVEACLIVDTRNQLSTLTSSFIDVSTIVSTLSYYSAVEACLIVDTRAQLSTLSTAVHDIYDVSLGKQVQFSTFSPGVTSAGHLVSTVISTLGWINTFSNTSGTTCNVELDLTGLGVWPNKKFDAMRFAHVGGNANVTIYGKNSATPTSLLGTLTPGDTLTFVWTQTSPSGTNREVSTSYFTLKGF